MKIPTYTFEPRQANQMQPSVLNIQVPAEPFTATADYSPIGEAVATFALRKKKAADEVASTNAYNDFERAISDKESDPRLTSSLDSDFVASEIDGFAKEYLAEYSPGMNKQARRLFAAKVGARTQASVINLRAQASTNEISEITAGASRDIDLSMNQLAEMSQFTQGELERLEVIFAEIDRTRTTGKAEEMLSASDKELLERHRASEDAWDVINTSHEILLGLGVMTRPEVETAVEKVNETVFEYRMAGVLVDVGALTADGDDAGIELIGDLRKEVRRLTGVSLIQKQKWDNMLREEEGRHLEQLVGVQERQLRKATETAASLSRETTNQIYWLIDGRDDSGAWEHSPTAVKSAIDTASTSGSITDAIVIGRLRDRLLRRDLVTTSNPDLIKKFNQRVLDVEDENALARLRRDIQDSANVFGGISTADQDKLLSKIDRQTRNLPRLKVVNEWADAMDQIIGGLDGLNLLVTQQELEGLRPELKALVVQLRDPENFGTIKEAREAINGFMHGKFYAALAPWSVEEIYASEEGEKALKLKLESLSALFNVALSIPETLYKHLPLTDGGNPDYDKWTKEDIEEMRSTILDEVSDNDRQHGSAQTILTGLRYLQLIIDIRDKVRDFQNELNAAERNAVTTHVPAARNFYTIIEELGRGGRE